MTIRDASYIQTDDELLKLVQQMRSCTVVGLDTEFMCDRTYYKKLALIQLCFDGKAVCVDPTRLNKLSLLESVLRHPHCIKVIHSAQGDCEALHHRLNWVPTPIFDTQIAAALCGYSMQIGYAKLVRRMLGIQLNKHDTRSDWLARPLSASMMEYALNDVRYLPTLFELLNRQLKHAQRESWLQQACHEHFQAEVLADGVENKVRQFGYKGYPLSTCEVYRKLLSWRKQQAMRLDIPMSHVLKEKSIQSILKSANPAQTFAQITGNDATQVGIEDQCQLLPQPLNRLKRHRRFGALFEAAQNILRERAAILGMEPSLLASTRVIDEMLCDEGSPSLFSGWRSRLLSAEVFSHLKSLRAQARATRVHDGSAG